jgi:hypothetical protein
VQQICFIKVCFQISGDVVHIGPRLDVRPRPMLDTR